VTSVLTGPLEVEVNETGVSITYGEYYIDFLVLDSNGDGIPDQLHDITISSLSDGVIVTMGVGAGVSTTDTDGDGKIDMISFTVAGISVSVIDSDGDSVFETVEVDDGTNLVSMGGTVTNTQTDTDGDGVVDTVTTTIGTETFTFLYGDWDNDGDKEWGVDNNHDGKIDGTEGLEAGSGTTDGGSLIPGGTTWPIIG